MEPGTEGRESRLRSGRFSKDPGSMKPLSSVAVLRNRPRGEGLRDGMRQRK